MPNAQMAKVSQAQGDFKTMQNALASQGATQQSGEQTQVRNDLTQQAQGEFNNPSRQAYYNTIYNTNLNNGLGQVENGYKNALTSSVTNAADKGLVGGTVDAQARANLSATEKQGAAQVAQGAQQAMQGAQLQDQSTLSNLMGLIQSGDPTQMAQYQAQIQQLGAQGQNLQQQAQNQQSNWNVGAYNTALQSAGIGGVVGAGATGASNAISQAAANSAWTGQGAGAAGSLGMGG
jgi:hypothetical protein